MEWTNLIEELNNFGSAVVNLYRDNLRQARTTGLLEDSISFEVVIDSDSISLQLTLQEYWKWLEEGRQPGKFPNINAIAKWITDKGIPTAPAIPNAPTLSQMTYLIGRKIANEGIEAKHYLGNTIEELQQEFRDRLADAIAKDIMIDIQEDLTSIPTKIGF